jgi:hypothetical protein
MWNEGGQIRLEGNNVSPARSATGTLRDETIWLHRESQEVLLVHALGHAWSFTKVVRSGNGAIGPRDGSTKGAVVALILL